MNRFFDIRGDVSMQLSPWEARNRGFDWTKAWHELRKSLRFRSDILGGTIRIYPGKISDLASIPKFAWSIFLKPDDPRIALGAWFHDEFYLRHGKVQLECGKHVEMTREEADRILAFEAMPDLFATPRQQHGVYQALRRFGQKWPGEPFLKRITW